MALEEFFEKKKRLYTQAVKGQFRNLKWILNITFLSIYCLSPFLRFDRGPYASNQAIFIDFSNSRLYFFSIEIWPQEIYYLAGILILAAVLLFFITSLFGRVWCGYACFQTVWTDIFILTEKIFQGDRNARIILDRKNSFEKFYKKFLTHGAWILISLATGYIFVCYFNDAFILTKNLLHFQINATALGWSLGIAASTYIMAGFAREHVCTYMCPYARFQSAMFDRDTLIITYDEKRGEPRGKLSKDEARTQGDCIDCKQCVVVCPQGIDIRNGLQMECIACGLCIDACDSVMDKIGLPRGLIRYDTEAHMQSPKTQNKFRIFRPRFFYYATILLTVSIIMLYNLSHKTTSEVSAVADRNPLFVKMSDGSVRNGYTIKISNKTHAEKLFSIKLIRPIEAEIKIESYSGASLEKLPVAAENIANFKIYITLPQEFLAKNDEENNDEEESNNEENNLINLSVIDQTSGEEKKLDIIFVGD